MMIPPYRYNPTTTYPYTPSHTAYAAAPQYPQISVPNQRNWFDPYPYTPSGTLPGGVYFSLPTQWATPVAKAAPATPQWDNHLKDLFHQREAVIFALNLRTFAAKDKNNDGIINPQDVEQGTFLKAIELLPRLKAFGINTIHLLPINPVGTLNRLGDLGGPGSLYSPAALDKINPEFDEPNNTLSVVQEARQFVDAAHKLGIHVMVDVPSCASIDLSRKHPELMAKDKKGNLLTPTDWVDIRMFVKDSPALRRYFDRYFDLMVNELNVDGFRVDIARARTDAFWKYFIGKYPDKAWLAETYTEEDASPLKNIPRDRPEDLLKSGFDSYYGQLHIFHTLSAKEYIQYMKHNAALFKRTGKEKSLIGSFLTHDDPSAMEHGGPLYSKLISGLMATQPHTNPYIMDGFLTGFVPEETDHVGYYDIFNYRPPVLGHHPDIGLFLQKMLTLRKRYGPVFTRGKFIPLHISTSSSPVYHNHMIAFLRQHGNRTFLVLANKDVNTYHTGTIEIPGLKATQKLVNLAPSYGEPSELVVNEHQIHAAKLAPGRFYLFEIDLAPNIKKKRFSQH